MDATQKPVARRPPILVVNDFGQAVKHVLSRADDHHQPTETKRDPQLGVPTAPSSIRRIDRLREGDADICPLDILEIHASKLATPPIARKLAIAQLARARKPPASHHQAALAQLPRVAA